MTTPECRSCHTIGGVVKAKPAPPAEPYVRGNYNCNLTGPHDPHMWIDATNRHPVSCPGAPDPDASECRSCHTTDGRPHTDYCPDRYRGDLLTWQPPETSP